MDLAGVGADATPKALQHGYCCPVVPPYGTSWTAYGLAAALFAKCCWNLGACFRGGPRESQLRARRGCGLQVLLVDRLAMFQAPLEWLQDGSVNQIQNDSPGRLRHANIQCSSTSRYKQHLGELHHDSSTRQARTRSARRSRGYRLRTGWSARLYRTSLRFQRPQAAFLQLQLLLATC